MTEEQFYLPNSGLRWKGLTLAHRSSRDAAFKQKRAKRNTSNDFEITSDSFMKYFLGYAIGAVFLLFLAVAFFIYAW